MNTHKSITVSHRKIDSCGTHFLGYDSIFVLSNKCHVSCNWDYPVVDRFSKD